MLLKEMNFRDIVDKYLYIDAAGVAQNLGSIFEVTEDATGVLCYGYIDEQAGISFEILCCAVHDAAKKTLKLLHGNDEQSAKIRLSELLGSTGSCASERNASPERVPKQGGNGAKGL